MFGRSRPVVIERYGRRRSRWRPPRWLVLLSSGIVIGAGAVVVVQERYLPPRLSADASVALRSAYQQADAERLRLSAELGAITKRLDAALADRRRLADELAARVATDQRLRDDVASVVAALPPDPRGGEVEVRAGRFTAKGGMLAYDVVLVRGPAPGQPISGLMQFTVAGESARGTDTTLAPKAVELSIGGHAVLRGSLPLPEGFKPRQTTIQVLERAGGKALGMRVMLVR